MVVPVETGMPEKAEVAELPEIRAGVEAEKQTQSQNKVLAVRGWRVQRRKRRYEMYTKRNKKDEIFHVKNS